MNTLNESLQSRQAKAIPDPRGVLSQLLGEVKELREFVVQTRDIQLGQAAHMEEMEKTMKMQAAYAVELEKRIARLESGGF